MSQKLEHWGRNPYPHKFDQLCYCYECNQIRKEYRRNIEHIQPTRHYSRMIELTFWQALKRFLKHGKWSWQKMEFDAVYKGDPRYDAAPFEEGIVWSHLK